MLIVRVFSGVGRLPLAEHVIDDDAIIGRGRDCSVRVDDVRASRHHCRVRRTARGWLLRDLGSTGGTYVGEQRVEAHLVCDGDRARVGDTVLAFSDPRPQPPADAGPPGLSTGTGAIERVTMALAASGVPPPPTDRFMAARAVAFDRWHLGTRWLPGGLCGQAALLFRELRQGGCDPLLAFGLEARGQGPAAMHYYRVDGPLALLLELRWADAFLDKADAAAAISTAWDRVASLLAVRDRLAAALGPRGRLVVCAADARDSFWVPGLGRPGAVPVDAPGPLAALQAALEWALRMGHVPKDMPHPAAPPGER